MVENELRQLIPPNKESALSLIMALEPRLQEEVDLDVRFVTHIDSCDMDPRLWDLLAETIFSEYEHYDGFVVTHGTDTMAYTTSALSFALQGLGKPVVFTGAQVPGYQLESDGRRNFINAVRLAKMDVSGVLLLFGDAVFLGSRVSKVSHSKLSAFASVNKPVLAEIGLHVQFASFAKKRTKETLKLFTGFDPQICVISLVPGVSLDLFTPLLHRSLAGVVLIAFGTGNIPDYHLPFLAKAKEAKVPVLIRSQCLEGATKMHIYKSGRQALEYNIIEAYDMSLESSITKLMWALHKKVPYEQMRHVMHQEMAGEIAIS